MRGDGLIHVLGVFHYVNEAVQTDEPKQTPILKVKDLYLDFAIALDRGGKGIGLTPVAADVVTIRERIVHDAIAGAKVLSDYLATCRWPALSHALSRVEGEAEGWAVKRNEIDLKRAELERLQHDLELFGPDPND